MNVNVMRLMLREEYDFDLKKIIKLILSLIFVGYLFTLLSIYLIDDQVTTLLNIFPGITMITIYYTHTYLKSKLSSDKIRLYKVLPFRNLEIYISYNIILFFNVVCKKIAVFLIPLYLTLIFKFELDYIYCLKDFFRFILANYFILLISMLLNLEIINKNKIGSLVFSIIIINILYFNIYKNILAVIGFVAIFFIIGIKIFEKDFKYLKDRKSKNLSNKKMTFLKREYIRFWNQKVMVINHFATLVFFMFFIYMFIVKNGFISSVLYSILFIPVLINTSSIVFSIDKDSKKLISILPINKYKYFFTKYIFTATITIPIYLVVFYIFNLLKIEGINQKAQYLIIFVANLVLITKLYYDYKNPKYDFSHIKQLLESSRRFVFYVIVLVYFLPFLFFDSLKYNYITIIEFAIFITCILSIRLKFKRDKFFIFTK